MATLKTMMMALVAGSLAATAGGVAYAKTDGKAFDPAQFQQRLEKRVDRALSGTDATADQKKQVADILGQTFKDMKPLHDQRVQNRKAMEEALQAPTIDPAKIEGIRAEQMKIARDIFQATLSGEVVTARLWPVAPLLIERESVAAPFASGHILPDSQPPVSRQMLELSLTP